MGNVLTALLATMITVPIVTWLLVYTVARSMYRNNLRAFRLACGVSTFFLIISVHYIIMAMTETSYLWAILVFLLGFMIIFAILYRIVKGDMNIVKIIRGYWRVNFFFFLLAYLILFIYGLVLRIQSSLS